jgi:hypothetical protein
MPLPIRICRVTAAMAAQCQRRNDSKRRGVVILGHQAEAETGFVCDTHLLDEFRDEPLGTSSPTRER